MNALNARTAFVLVITSFTLAANALMMPGCATVRYPSCGSWQKRSNDGATCRECIDKKGRYAECGLTIDRRGEN